MSKLPRALALVPNVALVLLASSMPALANDTQSSEATTQPLRVATWNLEHFATPIDKGCKPRTPQNVAQMRSYAQSLDADIVALQEVASKQAAHALFPADQWQIIMSDRADSEPYSCRESGNTSTQQKVAYAVKSHIAVNASESIDEFGLDKPGLRFALQIDVDTPVGAMKLLNVHLKSGCFVDNYTRADSSACSTFAQQAPLLENWIDQQEAQNQPYLVLGDFNHRLSAPYNHLTQQITQDNNGNPNSLVNTGASLISCHPYYPAPIDHILAGKLKSSGLAAKTNIHAFADMQVDNMLSDHCAVVTTIDKPSRSLTNSVKWLTTSSEYQALTRATYAIATSRLANVQKTTQPWVVVMDLDETVLDNSDYQVNLDKTGSSYTSESWDNWVKSEKATLVPGAADFIQSVFAAGGKLMFITNRSRALDGFTWNTLLAQLPFVNQQNSCLIGRAKEDKDAINGTSIRNDKDLRRVQVTNGSAPCFTPTNTNKPQAWSQGYQIAMQVGDNIEDFATVTQEDELSEDLLDELNKSLFLLPNPMYGSW